jgi:hypothetical protein
MAANGSEKTFCVLIFHEMSVSYNCPAAILAPNSVKKHHLTTPFEGGMHSFKRQGACVIGKAQFGMNSITVFMFVEPQMGHI